MSRLKQYKFINKVEQELKKSGVEYVKEEVGAREFSVFNHQFLLSLSCYMPSVAKKLLGECEEDIKVFGFKYAQEKWSKFITGSLTGKGSRK